MGARLARSVLFAALVVTCTPSVSTGSPSPSPTPSPTLFVATFRPTPTPSPSPTRSSQPPVTELPTSTAMGQRLLPLYLQIRQTFTALPPTAYILPDEPNTSDANAIFYGLAPDGIPQFAVRSNFTIDMATAAHETGHAYQKVLERTLPGTRNVMDLYWSFRGFPGTWRDALKQSQLESTPTAQWKLNPFESWAEAFRIAYMRTGTENTEDYKKPLDAAAARQFFLSLQSK